MVGFSHLQLAAAAKFFLLACCIFITKLTVAKEPASKEHQNPGVATVAEDSLETEQFMPGFFRPPAPPIIQQSAALQQQGGARQARSQGMNPNISAIGTFLGTLSGAQALERNVNVGLQEAEFSFQAVVDPYATANFFVAAGRHAEPPQLPGAEHDVGEEHGADEAALEFELEEVFVTLLHLPLNTQLKLGKFRPKFGKLNETHPHAYNIVDLPLFYQYFWGAEGFNDQGVSFRWLLPNPLFFQELTFQILDGPDENFTFARDGGNRLVYLGHLKNFIEINENTTLEVGLLATTGPNHEAGRRTDVFAGDMTLKWKPLQRNRYRSLEWISEFLYSKRQEASGGSINSFGWFTHLRYQPVKRWFFGGMLEYSEYPEFDRFHHRGISGIVQFYATEFQKFEIQTRYNSGNFFDGYLDLFVRAVFVIGAHGAHQY